MNNPATERRQHTRVIGDGLPLILQEGAHTPLRVRDLSESGVAFFSETPVPVMTRVAFTLEIPRPDGDAAFVEGQGVVVRCERLSSSLGHYEVALFVNQLDTEARASILTFAQTQMEAGREA